MPLTGVVYFSHEQKSDNGELIGEAVTCTHCEKPLVAEPFLIMVRQPRTVMDPAMLLTFAHIRCEKEIRAADDTHL